MVAAQGGSPHCSAVRGFRVLGLDPSPAMILSARQQRLDALEVEFQLCEARPLEAQSEVFDGRSVFQCHRVRAATRRRF